MNHFASVFEQCRCLPGRKSFTTDVVIVSLHPTKESIGLHKMFSHEVGNPLSDQYFDSNGVPLGEKLSKFNIQETDKVYMLNTKTWFSDK